MKTELEQLRAENKYLDNNLKMIGNLLIDYFAYRQRTAISTARSASEILIERENDVFLQNEDQVIQTYQKSFSELEEAREVGYSIGLVLTGNPASSNWQISNVLSEVNDFQGRYKWFHNFDQVIFDSKIPYSISDQKVKMPVYIFCFCLSKFADEALKRGASSLVSVNFNLKNKNFIVNLETEINPKASLNQVEAKEFSLGIFDHVGDVMFRLYGGKTISHVANNQIKVELSLPLITQEDLNEI